MNLTNRLRSWPVRWKLTAWSALVAGLAVVSFGVGVSVHLKQDGIGEVHNEMKGLAKQFFRRLSARSVAEGKKVVPGEIRDFLPEAPVSYFIEVEMPPNHVVYRSPNLKDEPIPALPVGSDHIQHLRDKEVLVNDFEENGTRLRMAADLYYVNETAEDLIIAYAVALPVALLVAGLGGWWLARKALIPVQRITRMAERLTAERLDQRLPAPAAHDEIGHLTDVLNSMIDRLERSFKQATRFTADASHELKTPLTIIRGEIESALRFQTFEPAQEKLLLNLLEETNHLASISQGLLLLSRADAGKFQPDLAPLDLSSLLTDLLDDAEILAAAREVEIETAVPVDAWVRGNSEFLWQLLLNLFENAVKYNRPGGRVRVELKPGPSEHVIVVGNTGPGISPEQAGQVFDRFFRGDVSRSDRRSGHGLGLSLCREIARAHGGDVVLSEATPRWTEFRLTLPAIAVPARAAELVSP